MDTRYWRRVGIRILLFVAVAQLVGYLGALVTFDAIPTWYAGLSRPSFSPPNWLFGPVWILLYSCMGVAAALLYGELGHKTDAKRALMLYWVQLLINGIWTPIFFGLKRPDVALYVILALDIVVAALIWMSYSIKRFSAYLLLPYLAWILFATALNFAIVRLNF